nr:Dihydrofolate reductase [uncultured bacterium]
MKNIIVAYGQNREIGKDGDLLWQRDLPADLQHFKQLTTGNAIIMGRVTFTDDLKKRILPNRQTIVVTRQPDEFDGATVTHSMQEAYNSVEAGRETFVIGGAQIYEQALNDADRVYATEVDVLLSADKYFPELDESVWREVSREHHEADEKDKYAYDFVIFDRVRD